METMVSTTLLCTAFYYSLFLISFLSIPLSISFCLSPLHHTPSYFSAFHLLAAHGKGFMEMKFAHSITLKAKTQNRNIIDALYYAKNSKKLTPYAVSTYVRSTNS
jgi:hypothetical protein